jgi:hypothetical protein
MQDVIRFEGPNFHVMSHFSESANRQLIQKPIIFIENQYNNLPFCMDCGRDENIENNIK